MFAVNLRDRLFGKKVTITVPTPTGLIERRVSEKWLEKMQAEGHFDAVPLDGDDYVIVHLLDSERGYRVLTWKVGEDISPPDLARCRDADSQDLYVFKVSDGGGARAFALRKAAWAALRERPLIPASAPVQHSPLGPLRADLPLTLRLYLRRVQWQVRFITWLRRSNAREHVNATGEFDRKERRYFWTRLFLAAGAIGTVIWWVRLPAHTLPSVPALILAALNFAGAVAAVIAVPLVSLRWFNAFRQHGRRLFSRTRKVAAIYRQTKQGTEVGNWWGLTLCGTLAVLAIGWLVGFRRTAGVSMFWWVTLLGYTLAMVPPTVLFLGASSARTLELLARLRAKSPCRIAALLDSSVAMLAPVGEFMSIDNFRVDERVEWQQLVLQLKQICPLCVLDTSVPTDHVMFEAHQLLCEERRNGVVVIADDSGVNTVLQALADRGDVPDVDVHPADPTTLDSTIRVLLWRLQYGDRLKVPIPTRRLADLLALSQQLAPERPRFDFEGLLRQDSTLCEFAFTDSNRTFRSN